MLNQGKYPARATQWDLGFASTGSEQIAVLFEITAGEELGRSITWYGYFTDATYERTVESLRTMGWQGNDLATIDGLDAHEVQIVVEHEPDDKGGPPRARVKWVNKLGGSLALKTVMDDRQKQEFARKMKAKLLAMGGGKPAGASTQTRPAISSNSGQRRGGPPEPPPLAEDPRYDRRGPSQDDIPF